MRGSRTMARAIATRCRCLHHNLPHHNNLTEDNVTDQNNLTVQIGVVSMCNTWGVGCEPAGELRAAGAAVGRIAVLELRDEVVRVRVARCLHLLDGDASITLYHTHTHTHTHTHIYIYIYTHTHTYIYIYIYIYTYTHTHRYMLELRDEVVRVRVARCLHLSSDTQGL